MPTAAQQQPPDVSVVAAQADNATRINEFRSAEVPNDVVSSSNLLSSNIAPQALPQVMQDLLLDAMESSALDESGSKPPISSYVADYITGLADFGLYLQKFSSNCSRSTESLGSSSSPGAGSPLGELGLDMKPDQEQLGIEFTSFASKALIALAAISKEALKVSANAVAPPEVSSATMKSDSASTDLQMKKGQGTQPQTSKSTESPTSRAVGPAAPSQQAASAQYKGNEQQGTRISSVNAAPPPPPVVQFDVSLLEIFHDVSVTDPDVQRAATAAVKATAEVLAPLVAAGEVQPPFSLIQVVSAKQKQLSGVDCYYLVMDLRDGKGFVRLAAVAALTAGTKSDEVSLLYWDLSNRVILP